MQTNEVRNAIVHYRRAANGALEQIERVETGGTGFGTFKPLSGQENAPNAFEGAGSVILAPDLRPLFTTNGGGNSVSSFGIRNEGRVTLLDVNSPFALPEHRERQVRLLRLAAGEADVE